MRVGALSISLSHLVATANYDPVKMAGAIIGAAAARGLATIAWNKRPPR
jgi:hypothetical protein